MNNNNFIVKPFRKFPSFTVQKNIINLKFQLLSSESQTSTLSPILGQYQMPIDIFFDSYNEMVLNWSDGLENRVHVHKIDSLFNFTIDIPRITFLVYIKFLDYGFAINDFDYDEKYIYISDFQYFVVCFSNKYFKSYFSSAKILLGYFKSFGNFKILF